MFHLGSVLKQAGYRFTTVSPATHERVNRRNENQWGNNLTDVFGWSRPFHPQAIPPDVLACMDLSNDCDPHEDGYKSKVRFSTLDDLLFVHSAFPTLRNDSVFFGPDTYRFALALKDLLGRGIKYNRIVDLGCGAGPGAILAALANPQAEVIASDINGLALHHTQENARLAGATNLVAIESDLFNQLDGDFDLIIANPPFILDPLERAYRHGGGLYGSEFSFRIVREALFRLRAGGTLLLYTGHVFVNNRSPFLTALEELLEMEGAFASVREVDPDIFGEELDSAAYSQAERIAAVVLEIRRS